ncbi:MAG: hypothetical protein KAT85_11385, partial [candidate division Zixibacteria bacterium]|nr:hypothetical protein [candidate division Zixibacteria bacterium]
LTHLFLPLANPAADHLESDIISKTQQCLLNIMNVVSNLIGTQSILKIRRAGKRQERQKHQKRNDSGSLWEVPHLPRVDHLDPEMFHRY